MPAHSILGKFRGSFHFFALAFAVSGAAASPRSPEFFRGTVSDVHDGDTITVTFHNNGGESMVRVRLAYIDAPELSQPHGAESRRALASLCLHHYVTVEVVDVDKYGRAVGRVRADGTDANYVQVATGLAWVYVKYAGSTTGPRAALYTAESAARQARLGLWRDDGFTPPWEWRHGRSPRVFR